MFKPATAHGIDREGLARLADGLIVAVAISLPWSTSATSVLAVLWVVALLPTVRWADIRRELATPAGGLPVLLVALGLAGMVWADVTLLERWRGFDSFVKLLAIPLLFLQFRRSPHGHWVFGAYLLSCVALLAVTTVVMAILPSAFRVLHYDNVLVKNAATQSGEFVTCIFGLLYLAGGAVEKRRWPMAFGAGVIILAMLANILYVSTGRTALVVAIVLIVLFAVRHLRPKSIAFVLVGIVLLGTAGWTSSSYLRSRAGAIWGEIQKYEADNERTSSGERIEFWKKSIEFIRQSSLIGHGTGSIRSQFAEAAIGRTGAAGVVAANPHNQTLAVGIQLGLLGIAVLWAMWIAHVLLFRGDGLVNWVGLVIVVQNIIGSLFNSHLFDFVQGWVYIVGVGVARGVVVRAQSVGEPERRPNGV
jgi:O-antigen ligase